METAQSLHDYWFGGVADDAAGQRQGKLWWGKDVAIDAELTERFGSLVTVARAGQLAQWSDSPRGRLALILLTDQLPRNIFRGTPGAFASDLQARQLCLAGLERGDDKVLEPIERVFFYLPLEHSESMPDQDHAVRLFTALFQAVPQAVMEQYRGFLTYALRHRHVIERFGRFPHRNAILGRQSSPEETAFLAEPGSSF
ncbi:DUF924 family protein [Noviherbaspirillum soli]|uniref:DUF924 family protein n=1 Tax=Noviherbaspirillum soli TaxID=1064518 RepID=UPI00188AD24E|nr:DUF924 family protein [Noviherbaspirillum soli]